MNNRLKFAVLGVSVLAFWGIVNPAGCLDCPPFIETILSANG